MGRHQLHLTEPASRFIDSFLLGNGRLGVTVAGGIGIETFDLNADDLWSGGPGMSDGDARTDHLVEPLREAIRDEDWGQVNALGRQLQGSGWTQSYQPVGRLSWRYGAGGEIGDYGRSLDLAAAVATTSYTAMGAEQSLRAFVSAPDDVLVAFVASSEAEGAAEFDSPHPLEVDEVNRAGNTTWHCFAGRVPAMVFPDYAEDADPVRYARDRADDDGSVAAGMGFALVVAVQRRGDGTRLIATAVTGFRGWDRRPSADLRALADEARRRVKTALERETTALLERHVTDHAEYFERMDLDLSPSEPAAGGAAARAQLYFDVGRYLLISSSRPGTQAANLQGIWNVDVRPAWSSNYTTNINLEMNYWGAEQLGLGDAHRPLLELARDLAAAGAGSAARYYGARGATVHHNTDLWRFTAPVKGDPQWSNWPTGLGWIAAHSWDHIDYGSADDEFVGRVAWPVHREAALFLLDLLEDDGAGHLTVSPSTSPEHSFVVNGTRCAISAGSAMDQEIVWQTLGRLLLLAERVGVDEHDPLLQEARDALGRLRPPAVVDGVLHEWSAPRHPEEPGHRHLSHLYGLYPGTRVSKDETPDEWRAWRAALEVRLANGSGYTGWSQAWVLCLAARFYDAELASKAMDVLTGPLSSASLLDLHPHGAWPGGAIFQIDGNLGALAGVAELLVQGTSEHIDLLPALPPAWRSGSARGLRVRGGHEIDLVWDNGVLVSARVHAGRDGALSVRVAGVHEHRALLQLTAGEVAEVFATGTDAFVGPVIQGSSVT